MSLLNPEKNFLMCFFIRQSVESTATTVKRRFSSGSHGLPWPLEGNPAVSFDLGRADSVAAADLRTFNLLGKLAAAAAASSGGGGFSEEARAAMVMMARR